ncbi:MAG: sigma 54-interacting transcriptional regulator [Candidatus Eisenbacteria bacterium]
MCHIETGLCALNPDRQRAGWAPPRLELERGSSLTGHRTEPQPPGPKPTRGSQPKQPIEIILSPILGASQRMQRLLRLVARVAPTDSAVLLLGESGTGKELVARSLHVLSKRTQGPFVPVNVGALPESLIESELFGYAKGAFTGASTDRPGLVEEADRGTLFLDEIGDMPLATQVKLLRTLENNEVRRVGENTPRIVDVRIVAATHRDLQQMVSEGRFRADLYYRLNVVQLEMPPLRERKEDIGLLASYFLDRAAKRLGRPVPRLASEAMMLLERYDYPGNVRELENAIEHAVAVSEGDQLTAAELPSSISSPRLLGSGAFKGSTLGGDDSAPASNDATDERSLEEVTREHVLRVLARQDGNATAAAKRLGISRTTMWRMLKRYGALRGGA